MEHDIWVMRECVKAWLKHIYECSFTIERLEDIRARVYSSAEKTTSISGESVSGGIAEDALAKMMVRLEELDEQLADAHLAAADVIASAAALCECSVPRWVCYMHWAEHRPWEEVSRKVGYSERHTRMEIARQGVEELYPLIPEEYRRYTFPSSL